MIELENIWDNRASLPDICYTDNIALALQPTSYSEFRSHPEFPDVYRLWTQGDSFRGMDFARVWGMVLNVKHILQKTDGAVAELGVYKGQSSALLSYLAEKFQRKMYLIDTFKGFAEAQYEEDMGEGKKNAFTDTSLEAARSVVGNYEGNRWIVGMFPDSATPELSGDQFSFVSIDCDIYEPIRAGLEFFWPRMKSGGMIFTHDYSSGHWPGATRAVDEFCAKYNVAGCLLPDFAGSYILVKQ